MYYLFNTNFYPLLLSSTSTSTSTEIARVRASLFQINNDEHKPLILPEPDGSSIVNKMEKVYVPVDEHPDVSFLLFLFWLLKVKLIYKIVV